MMSRLREKADELGLHALGVAPAIDEVREVYPWAESVIVAAISYLPPEPNIERDRGPRGLVARFARGADYHVVLREKLVCLADTLDARGEVCVDTCPLPERKLAVLAGVAWRGRNGNVFVDGCGSYVALGEVVTDLDLPKSEPRESDRCGECDRCIRACPTRAIAAPHVVDRSRCLSHITQCSGTVAVEFRKALGNRIYGCDVCQEACPQNVGLQSITPEFAETTFPGARPELVSLINLTAGEFRRTIERSSIGWIRRTRIRRNAIIAAGNLCCAEALPTLEFVLDDEDPTLREHAEWAIKEIRARTAK